MLLVLVVIENRRGVLVSTIDELPPRIRGIDRAPEGRQQPFVGDPFRIVIDLDALQVSGGAARNLFMGGIFRLPPV